MPVDFELLAPGDKPALIGFSHAEQLSTTETVLVELGYKVHAASNHEDFLNRFGQVQYQVVVIEENFNATTLSENLSLTTLQKMPMNFRRHAVLILVGNSFQSLNPLQAFQQSVHVVVNPLEMIVLLGQVIQKAVVDNNLFLSIFRETQLRIAQGKT